MIAPPVETAPVAHPRVGLRAATAVTPVSDVGTDCATQVEPELVLRRMTGRDAAPAGTQPLCVPEKEGA
jgi:hypothetical protein